MLQSPQSSPGTLAPSTAEVAALICLLMSDLSMERQAGLLAHPGFGPLIRAAFDMVEPTPAFQDPAGRR
ncbi:MAG TPA: hypothetical protein VD995_17910 [Azospirillum sp.]|nr:hypothetical protein [Azospirillum sp.]